jgi:hypothetical protein
MSHTCSRPSYWFSSVFVVLFDVLLVGGVPLQVGVERGQPLEAAPAEIARELHDAGTVRRQFVVVRRVDLLVGVQRRRLDKPLAADAAHVGALPRVRHLVPL